MLPDERKTCSKCNQSKFLSEFAKRKLSKDGLQVRCKDCNNSNNKKWYKNNIEQHSNTSNRNYNKNKERYNERSTKWYKNNKAKHIELMCKHRENNRGWYRDYWAKRRALLMKSIPDFVIGCDIESKRIKDTYELCTRITKATGIEHHVDHMIPLSKGGWHWSANLQILTAHENVTKHAKVNPDVKKTIEEMYNNATR
jgi:hypothetical protein